MGDSLSSDISRQPRILLQDRAGRSGRGRCPGVVDREGPGRCECVGGKAGRGYTTFSEPNANSPGTIGHAHHGRGPLPTWPSQARRALVSAAVRSGALGWVPAESAREGPATSGVPGGRRDCWEGSGPPPSALCPPCPPTRSSRLRGKSLRCSQSALPAPRSASTCRARRVGTPPSWTPIPSSPSVNLPPSYPPLG